MDVSSTPVPIKSIIKPNKAFFEHFQHSKRKENKFYLQKSFKSPKKTLTENVKGLMSFKYSKFHLRPKSSDRSFKHTHHVNDCIPMPKKKLPRNSIRLKFIRSVEKIQLNNQKSNPQSKLQLKQRRSSISVTNKNISAINLITQSDQQNFKSMAAKKLKDNNSLFFPQPTPPTKFKFPSIREIRFLRAKKVAEDKAKHPKNNRKLENEKVINDSFNRMKFKLRMIQNICDGLNSPNYKREKTCY